MSLQAILEHILGDAHSGAERITREVEIEAAGIIQAAKKEADKLYREILEKERAAYERHKQQLVVKARLEAKKNLLQTKQELIDSAFQRLKSGLKGDRFKKQEVSFDKIKEVGEEIGFYLDNLRHDYEIEIAEILFT